MSFLGEIPENVVRNVFVIALSIVAIVGCEETQSSHSSDQLAAYFFCIGQETKDSLRLDLEEMRTKKCKKGVETWSSGLLHRSHHDYPAAARDFREAIDLFLELEDYPLVLATAMQMAPVIGHLPDETFDVETFLVETGLDDLSFSSEVSSGYGPGLNSGLLAMYLFSFLEHVQKRELIGSRSAAQRLIEKIERDKPSDDIKLIAYVTVSRGLGQLGDSEAALEYARMARKSIYDGEESLGAAEVFVTIAVLIRATDPRGSNDLMRKARDIWKMHGYEQYADQITGVLLKGMATDRR